VVRTNVIRRRLRRRQPCEARQIGLTPCSGRAEGQVRHANNGDIFDLCGPCVAVAIDQVSVGFRVTTHDLPICCPDCGKEKASCPWCDGVRELPTCMFCGGAGIACPDAPHWRGFVNRLSAIGDGNA
jgi:hypothetical protein